MILIGAWYIAKWIVRGHYKDQVKKGGLLDKKQVIKEQVNDMAIWHFLNILKWKFPFSIAFIQEKMVLKVEYMLMWTN